MELVSGTSGTSIIDMGDSSDKDIGVFGTHKVQIQCSLD